MPEIEAKYIAFDIAYKPLLDGKKTVTRRARWPHVKVGDVVDAVRHVSKKPRGAPHAIRSTVVLARIRILDVRREPLSAVTEAEVALEGFAGKSVEEFVALYCRIYGLNPGRADKIECTRIEFELMPN